MAVIMDQRTNTRSSRAVYWILAALAVVIAVGYAASVRMTADTAPTSAASTTYQSAGTSGTETGTPGPSASPDTSGTPRQ